MASKSKELKSEHKKLIDLVRSGSKDKSHEQAALKIVDAMYAHGDTKAIRRTKLILRKSKSNDFFEAFKEWEPISSSRLSDENKRQNCDICNHPNIKSWFTYANQKTDETIITGSDCAQEIGHTIYIFDVRKYSEVPNNKEIREISKRNDNLEKILKQGTLSESIKDLTEKAKKQFEKLANLPSYIWDISKELDNINLESLFNVNLTPEEKKAKKKIKNPNPYQFLKQEFEEGKLPPYLAGIYVRFKNKLLSVDKQEFTLLHLYEEVYNDKYSKEVRIGSLIADVKAYKRKAAEDSKIKERFGELNTKKLEWLINDKKKDISRAEAALALRLRTEKETGREYSLLDIRKKLNKDCWKGFEWEGIETFVVDKMLLEYNQERKDWHDKFKEGWEFDAVFNKKDYTAMKDLLELSTITARDWKTNMLSIYSIDQMENLVHRLVSIRRKMRWQKQRDDNPNAFTNIIDIEKYWMVENFNNTINKNISTNSQINLSYRKVLEVIENSGQYSKENFFKDAKRLLKYRLFNKSKQNLDKLRDVYNSVKNYKPLSKKTVKKIRDFSENPLIDLYQNKELKIPEQDVVYNPFKIRQFEDTLEKITKVEAEFAKNKENIQIAEGFLLMRKDMRKRVRIMKESYFNLFENSEIMPGHYSLKITNGIKYTSPSSIIEHARKFDSRHVTLNTTDILKKIWEVSGRSENSEKLKALGLNNYFFSMIKLKQIIGGSNEKIMYMSKEAYKLFNKAYEILKERDDSRKTDYLLKIVSRNDTKSRKTIEKAPDNSELNITIKNTVERDKYECNHFLKQELSIKPTGRLDKNTEWCKRGVNVNSYFLKDLADKVQQYNKQHSKRLAVTIYTSNRRL